MKPIGLTVGPCVARKRLRLEQRYTRQISGALKQAVDHCVCVMIYCADIRAHSSKSKDTRREKVDYILSRGT